MSDVSWPALIKTKELCFVSRVEGQFRSAHQPRDIPGTVWMCLYLCFGSPIGLSTGTDPDQDQTSKVEFFYETIYSVKVKYYIKNTD
jgi:hypothetical protein